MKEKEYCSHCGGEIKNHHYGWHRKGHHYCCYGCYADDKGGVPSHIVPIDRKHKNV
jgi:hypothetical protein